MKDYYNIEIFLPELFAMCSISSLILTKIKIFLPEHSLSNELRFAAVTLVPPESLHGPIHSPQTSRIRSSPICRGGLNWSGKPSIKNPLKFRQCLKGGVQGPAKISWSTFDYNDDSQ